MKTKGHDFRYIYERTNLSLHSKFEGFSKSGTQGCEKSEYIAYVQDPLNLDDTRQRVDWHLAIRSCLSHAKKMIVQVLEAYIQVPV